MSDSLIINQFRSVPVPYIIVGDEAFGLSETVMRPYARTRLTYKKKIFNYRLTRARRLIESTFGILSNKFRIFHRAMNFDVDLTVDIVKCVCILHNFIRVRDGYESLDSLTINGFYDDNEKFCETNKGAYGLRDIFAEYFVTCGRVPWQDNCIF